MQAPKYIEKNIDIKRYRERYKLINYFLFILLTKN